MQWKFKKLLGTVFHYKKTMKIGKTILRKKKQELQVETYPILADIGKSAGFKVVDIIGHGLSKADKGRIGVEEILVFQKYKTV